MKQNMVPGRDAAVVRVARLDHDLVYWGLDERPAESVQPGELVFCAAADAAPAVAAGGRWVDTDCDLPGGIYRWDAELGRFEPLPKHQRKEAPLAPTLEQAFYDYVTNGPTGARVTAWTAWFKKTMDEKAAK